MAEVVRTKQNGDVFDDEKMTVMVRSVIVVVSTSATQTEECYINGTFQNQNVNTVSTQTGENLACLRNTNIAIQSEKKLLDRPCKLCGCSAKNISEDFCIDDDDDDNDDDDVGEDGREFEDNDLLFSNFGESSNRSFNSKSAEEETVLPVDRSSENKNNISEDCKKDQQGSVKMVIMDDTHNADEVMNQNDQDEAVYQNDPETLILGNKRVNGIVPSPVWQQIIHVGREEEIPSLEIEKAEDEIFSNNNSYRETDLVETPLFKNNENIQEVDTNDNFSDSQSEGKMFDVDSNQEFETFQEKMLDGRIEDPGSEPAYFQLESSIHKFDFEKDSDINSTTFIKKIQFLEEEHDYSTEFKNIRNASHLGTGSGNQNSKIKKQNGKDSTVTKTKNQSSQKKKRAFSKTVTGKLQSKPEVPSTIRRQNSPYCTLLQSRTLVTGKDFVPGFKPVRLGRHFSNEKKELSQKDKFIATSGKPEAKNCESLLEQSEFNEDLKDLSTFPDNGCVEGIEVSFEKKFESGKSLLQHSDVSKNLMAISKLSDNVMSEGSREEYVEKNERPNESLSEGSDMPAGLKRIAKFTAKNSKIDGKVLILTCPNCTKFVSAKKGLDDHLKRCKKAKRVHQCEICEQKFNKCQSLYKHKECHKKYDVECPICKRPCESKSSLATHMNTHRSDWFSCEYCNKEYKSKSGLKCHKRIHNTALSSENSDKGKSQDIKSETINDDDALYGGNTDMTDEGNVIFLNNDKLERIERKVQNTFKTKTVTRGRLKSLGIELELYKCKYCVTKCTSRAKYNEHMKIHKFGKFYKKKAVKRRTLKTYPCSVCNKIFWSAKKLKEHKDSSHIDFRSFVCSTCNKKFFNRYSLEQHVKTHEMNTSVACKFCSKVLQTKMSLKKHERKHDKKRFLCHVCGEGFGFLNELTQHRTITHKELKRAQCKICHVHLASSANLYMHMRIHNNIKPFSCKLCRRSFRINSNLKKHMRTHTGEKLLARYQCDLCGKMFGTHYNMKLHRMAHTGEKPFVCVVCGNKFRTRSSMNNHLKVHHQTSGDGTALSLPSDSTVETTNVTVISNDPMSCGRTVSENVIPDGAVQFKNETECAVTTILLSESTETLDFTSLL